MEPLRIEPYPPLTPTVRTIYVNIEQVPYATLFLLLLYNVFFGAAVIKWVVNHLW